MGDKVTLYSEAELGRKMGVTRERIRQLKTFLTLKPANRRLEAPSGYQSRDQRAFLAAMRMGVDKFVALVDACGDDECWRWRGGIDPNGYAVLRTGNVRRYVHRIAYIEAHGSIPKGHDVIHSCEHRDCCNPRHLVAVTKRGAVWAAKMKRRGFTLVELMVVLVVMALMFVVAASLIAGKGDMRKMLAFLMPREAAVLELQKLNDRADSVARMPAPAPVRIETVYVDSGK